MDGTLLNSKKQLPQDFTEVYNKMSASGIQFVVASGRQYYTLEDEFKHLNHNIAFVAENGGFIKWSGGEIVTRSIKPKDATGLINKIRAIEGANIVLCGKDGAYVEDTSNDFVNEMSKYYFRHKVVEDLTLVQDDILKIAVNDFSNMESSTYPQLKELSNDFQISTSSPIWLDIMPKGTNKGNAVKFLQEKFGISKEETVVFGDYLNDLEMMTEAKYSYAMANAHSLVIKAAAFEALSNDQEGVTKVIISLLDKH